MSVKAEIIKLKEVLQSQEPFLVQLKAETQLLIDRFFKSHLVTLRLATLMRRVRILDLVVTSLRERLFFAEKILRSQVSLANELQKQLSSSS